jgi:Asp-tRNA(Asn)/Glu-tRNA(Gln) amidotransferase A subunit family amidase
MHGRSSHPEHGHELGGALDGRLGGLARAVRDREVTAVGLVERSLARIEAARDLNAVILVRAEEALAEAAALDEVVLRGRAVGPLAGLPLLVKDIEDVAGLPTTHGSLLHRGAPPATADGLIPRRLRAAGAIVIGKTNVPEFAFEGYTDNRLFGATHNPWGRGWSPGGSSGGSAAALAAGLAPLATASDGGGSIRIPASLCGLVGIKPTNGVIGRDPITAWIDLSTDGPFATTVADLRLLLSLEAGPTPGDPTAQVGWRLGPSRMPKRALAAQRVVDWGWPLPEAVAVLFEQALTIVERELGLPVERVGPGQIIRSGNADDDWFTIAAVETLHWLGRAPVEARLDELDPALARWMRDAMAIRVDDYLAARLRQYGYVREMDDLLGEDVVLITPTLTVDGWTLDGQPPDRPDWAGPGMPLDAFNTGLQNMTGHPAITVPAGLSPRGLPFGLQVTAPRYREELLFGFAERWETARPWPPSAPGYEPFEA